MCGETGWEIVLMSIFHHGYKALNKIHVQFKTVELKSADKGDELRIVLKLRNIENDAYMYIRYGIYTYST